MQGILICTVTLLVFLCTAHAFFTSSSRLHRSSTPLSMIFGGTKKPAVQKKVVVKVDGKILETSEPSVNLRKFLMANKIDIYPLKAKITGNCGGAGICGTCAVKVLEGQENFNPPSKNEQLNLNGKPADIRLSCCSKISGPCSIKTKP